MTGVEASGRPGTWRAMLTDLGTALQRARLHGFSEREVEDARQATIAQAEEAVQRETTRPAREVLRQINGAVTRQEPVMSAAQSLALLRGMLPGVTAAEVSEAFTRNFDPGQVVFIAELPASDGVPTEAELLALGRAAVEVTPDKVAEVARATALLTTLPTGGTVVESRMHAASGVTSMWLDNGVRAHHRFMDERKNEASISITLAGGTIQETAADRGLTEAALRAWDRPATSALSSTAIRDLMTGAKVRVRSGMTGDTLTLTVSGDPAELERGLQLAYLLLTDPVIEPAALEQWKDGELQRIAARKSQPMQVLATTSAEAIYPEGRDAAQVADRRAGRGARPRCGPGVAPAPDRHRAHRGGRGGRHRPRGGDAPGDALSRRPARAPAHRRQDPVRSAHDCPAARADRGRGVDRRAHATGRGVCRLLRRRPRPMCATSGCSTWPRAS